MSPLAALFVVLTEDVDYFNLCFIAYWDDIDGFLIVMLSAKVFEYAPSLFNFWTITNNTPQCGHLFCRFLAYFIFHLIAMCYWFRFLIRLCRAVFIDFPAW